MCCGSFVLWIGFIVNFFVDCKTVRFFACSSMRQHSNKRSGMRLKIESKTGERDLGEMLWACGAFAEDSYTTLYRFLYWFWEKKWLFCSLIFLFVFFPTNPTCQGAWQYYSCNRLSVIARRLVTSITKVVSDFLKAKSGTYDVAFLLTDLQETNISLVSFKDFILIFKSHNVSEKQHRVPFSTVIISEY